MATYNEIKGDTIEVRATDPANPVLGEVWYNSTTGVIKGYSVKAAAWSSGGNLNSARETQGFGTLTAGLVAGGNTTSVEEYDGSTWTTSTALPADRNQTGPATQSPQTAGLIFAGNSPPGSATNTSLEWDGSAWTSGGNYPASLARLAGAGTQTSALGAGGKFPHSNVAATYDGSSWTAISNIGTARYGLAGGGASDSSAVIFGGSDQSFPTFNVVGNTEEWNGSSWTSSNSLNTARAYLAGCGTQTSALVGAGLIGSGTPPAISMGSAISEEYDGTSWAAAANPATARHSTGMGGSASTSAFMAGGNPTTGVVATTEEYNASPVGTVTLTTS